MSSEPRAPEAPTSGEWDRVQEAAQFLRSRVRQAPEAAIVLGSGLGRFASAVEGATTIAYEEIPHWPAATLIGHAKSLTAGTVASRRVAVLSGRAHRYEDDDRHAVAFGVRVMAALDVKTLVLTNAAGGINLTFPAGSVMVIDDHLNLMGDSPLIGPHDERFGARFPDLTNAYSVRLRDLADAVGAEVGVPLVHGVYAGVHGPSYETPAEIRYLRSIGADAVGMSTVLETIVARQMGLEVLGLSCITNLAAGVLPEPLHHVDVLEAAERLAEPFSALLTGIIGRL